MITKLNLQDKIWYGLTMTDAAARQIKKLVTSDPRMFGLRLSINHSGCAGFSYILDLITEPNKSDLVYEHLGAKLFVPLQVMPLIDGTRIDYIKIGLNYEFKFYNPKAQHACGCGESFII
ncbi:MAG: Fe-S cluster assembly scaffold SufA [Candidatus Baumannia cicadellinicola]|nr:Fe-S cluster assembly scaffold SufA [Candidatus Baumannia cicadellinicola]